MKALNPPIRTHKIWCILTVATPQTPAACQRDPNLLPGEPGPRLQAAFSPYPVIPPLTLSTSVLLLSTESPQLRISPPLGTGVHASAPVAPKRLQKIVQSFTGPCFLSGSDDENCPAVLETPGSILGRRRNSYPLQYPCLETSMDREGSGLQFME